MYGMVTLETLLGGTWLPSLLLLLFTVLLVLFLLEGRPKNFPPGPMMLSALGSLPSMPFGPSHDLLSGLRKKYGDLVGFGVLGTRMVLVSGVTNMKEVFNQKITAERPTAFVSTIRNKYMTNHETGILGIIASSGKLWQEQRRFVLHHLRDLGFGKTSFEPIIVEEIAELMEYLEKEEERPVEMRRYMNRSVINILWAMVMGRRYPYEHAKLQKLLKNFAQPTDVNVFNPLLHIPLVVYLVEKLPFLNKGYSGFQRIANFLKGEIEEFLANNEFRNDNNLISLYLNEIEKKENPNFNMDNLGALVYDMFFAGMETTTSTLITAIYLLAKHPLVQRRVQNELDEVVGQDRLPCFSDLEQLPFVHATISETQRILNLVKYSIPHSISQDIKIGNYDIPKDTWLLPNLNNCLTDPTYWENPKVFDPYNFLDENGKYKKNEAFMPFGVGKRLCAGEPLAKVELVLFFTHMFQRFTFTLVEEHKPIMIDNPLFNAPPVYTTKATRRFKSQ